MARYREEGFTLVELLVTLAMMGTIMAALYGSYQAVIRAREALGPSYNQTQRAVWMLDRMSRSLRGAYMTASNIKNVAMAGEVDGHIQPPGDFVGSSRTDRTELSFVSVRMAPGTEACTLERVYIRWMRSDRSVQMATTSAFIVPEPDVEEMLDWQCAFDSAETFTLAFLRQDQWVDDWPPEADTTLPEAIRISMTVQRDNERSKCWTATVLPALSPLADSIEESI